MGSPVKVSAMVSLVVKTHIQDILARLKDRSSELGDLEIVASNGSFLTSKVVMFSLLPKMGELLCKSHDCGGQGHDTITIVMPDLDVEDVVEAFEKLFTGNPRDVINILGFSEVCLSKESEEKEEQNVPFVDTDSKASELEEIDIDSHYDGIQKIKYEDENIVSIDLNIPNKNKDQFTTCEKEPTDNIIQLDSHYSCQQCGKSFITRKKVQRHVREVHGKGLTIPRPAKGYPCECGVRYTIFRSFKYCKCKTKKRKRLNHEQKVNDPWNKCQYKCEICHKIYIDKQSLRNHIKHNHKMDYLNDYIAQFGDPNGTNVNPKWPCSLCEVSVKFERRRISEHLAAQHNLDIVKYGEMYGVPARE